MMVHISQHQPCLYEERIPLVQTLQSQVIPTLVRLLGNPAVRFSVPRCLNRIIEGSDTLQKVATDFEAIPKLAHLLQAASSNQAALLVRPVT